MKDTAMTTMSADLKTAISDAVKAHVASVTAQGNNVLAAVEADFAGVVAVASSDAEKLKADVLVAVNEVKAHLEKVPHVGVVLGIVGAFALALGAVGAYVAPHLFH
jgi:hypothetical protein